MALSNQQQIFLNQLKRNKGDTYKTIADVGLEADHFYSWKEDLSFALAYKKTVQNIITVLNQENYVGALRKINEAVQNGVRQDMVTHSHKVMSNGESFFEVKTTSKYLGVPAEILKLCLQQNSISQAITLLCNEGVIPAALAEKINLKAEEITEEMAKVFDGESNVESLNESRLVGIIQGAVLGGSED